MPSTMPIPRPRASPRGSISHSDTAPSRMASRDRNGTVSELLVWLPTVIVEKASGFGDAVMVNAPIDTGAPCTLISAVSKGLAWVASSTRRWVASPISPAALRTSRTPVPHLNMFPVV